MKRSYGSIAQLAGLIILTGWLYVSLRSGFFANIDYPAPLVSAYRAIVVINYVLLLIAYVIHFRSKIKSSILSAAIWIATFLAGISIMPYVGGSIENLFRQCTGFLDEYRKISCVESWEFGATILIVYPFFIPLMTILAILLVTGIIKTIRPQTRFRK